MKRRLLVLVSVLIICLAGCGNQEETYSLEFVEGKMVTIDENEYVGVFFNFTNNSDETVMPADVVDVKAFQNGVELNVIVYTGTDVEEAIQCDTSVQAKTSTDVVWTFELQDTSTISLEYSNGQETTFEIQ